MISLCALASGSNGNCYYIGNEHDAILIDAGIPARRILARMRQREIIPDKIRAVFLSHEHADHASGARVLARRLRIPVFVTQKTYMAMYPNHKPAMPRFFVPGQEITVGSFHVHPFLKNHDAAEPCSFRIVNKGFHVGVFTDIGSPCERIIHHLSQCHALFLETNYDEKMLWEGSYPWPLKQRIGSDHGHLSNDQAFELLKNHSGSELKVVFLSHLSAENNTPETALNRFSELAVKISIHLTSRHAPGELVSMDRNTEEACLT
jgi:phosphoribosyl 1,2-cyclic phosphodiesterase